MKKPAKEVIGDGTQEPLPTVDENEEADYDFEDVDKDITIGDIQKMEIEEVQAAPDNDDEPITWEEVSYADKAVVDEMLVKKKYTYKTAEEIS